MTRRIEVYFSVLLLCLTVARTQVDFFKDFFSSLEGAREDNIVVVEYRPWADVYWTTNKTLNENVHEYINIIQDAVSNYKNIKMIIFPESTLDNVKTYKEMKEAAVKIKRADSPCKEHSEAYPAFMQKLACAAKQFKTTIVFNIIEESDFRYYTSDVVINHEGLIVLSIKRETRVGVTFLNNYPIPFAIPAKISFYISEVIGQNLHVGYEVTPTSFVTGFIFSFEKVISFDPTRIYVVCSNWISQLPFLTSLQVHQMWAEEFNINLFFSGANNPKKGQGGTGIFFPATGTIVMDIEPRGHNRYHVYNVRPPPPNRTYKPILTKQDNDSFDNIAEEMDFFQPEPDPDVHRYASQVFDSRTPSNYTVCYDKVPENHFCCHFRIKTTMAASDIAKNEYTYHLIAYKGYKTYYDLFEPGGVEICAVVACLNEKITSCGKRFKEYSYVRWPITFEELLIKARFAPIKREKVYMSSQFPNSLLSSLRPISPKATVWNFSTVQDENNNSYLERSFYLLEPQNRLLTFGIFGRNFTLVDYPSNKGNVNQASLIWLLVIIYIVHQILCF